MDSHKVNAPQRIKYLDIAKGLGIIYVVLGHNPLISSPANFLFYIIFLFHMPLFFLLSGLVNKSHTNLFLLFRNRFKVLLMPYFSTLLFLMPFLFLMGQINGDEFDLGFYIKKILYSTGPRLNWGVLWFLTSLFITQIFFYLIYIFILRNIDFLVVRFAIMVIFLGIGVAVMKKIWLIKLPILSSIGFFNDGIPGLPWSIDLIFITVFYYYLGTELKNEFQKWLDSHLLFIISSVSFFLLYLTFETNLDLNFRIYDSITINTLEAMFGIYITLYLSKKIAGNRFYTLGSLLSYLGRLSLVIFIFHVEFQEKGYLLLSSSSVIPIEIIFILSLIIGIVGPILIYEMMIKRIPILGICYPVKQRTAV